MRSASRPVLVLTALAATLALSSLPASAQEDNFWADDPMGSPSRYTVLAADDLWLAGRRIDDPGRPNVEVGWLQADDTLTSFPAQSALVRDIDAPPGPDDSQQLAVQAAGRFRDPYTPQVLTFQRGWGNDNYAYQLNPLNPVVEPDWKTKGIPGGPIPSYFFAAPLSDFSTSGEPELTPPYTMAAGDVDRTAGTDGHFHDEAVLAIGSAGYLDLRVVDYAANPGAAAVASLPPSAGQIEIGGIAEPEGAWFGGSLAVEVGDFDADGTNEIAVAYQTQRTDGWWDLKLAIFKYSDRQLTLAAMPALPRAVADKSGAPRASLDMAVGDFDGSGADQIAISQFGKNDVVTGTSVTLFGLDQKFAVKTVGQGVVQGVTDPMPGGNYSRDMRPKLEAGLFRFDPDPAKGYTLDRRQLALVYHDAAMQPRLQVFEVDGKSNYKCGRSDVDQQPNCSLEMIALTGAIPSGEATSKQMGLAAGNFAKPGGVNANQLWSIATADEAGHLIQIWQLSAGPGAGNTPYHLGPTAGYTIPSNLGPTDLVAYDRRGRSAILGAPARYTFSGIPAIATNLQDPPKHADWLDGGWQNVDRTSEFEITSSKTGQKDLGNATTTTGDTTNGISTAESAGVSGSIGLGPLGKVEVNADLRHNLNAQWTSSQGDTDRHSSSTSRTDEAGTGNDDLLVGRVINYTVWRYPILGTAPTNPDGTPARDAATGEPLTAFYEIEVPQPSQDAPFRAGGLDLAYYQPLHENGNVLSYPQLPPGGKLAPSDLGSYTFGADKSQQTLSGALFNDNYMVDQNSGSISFGIDQSDGGDHERTTAGTMTNSVDIKVSGSAGFSLPVIGGAKEHACVDFKYDHESSWSTIHTHEDTTTSSQEFVLNAKTGAPSGWAYGAGTAMYYTTDGVQKSTHAVNLRASSIGDGNWLQHYGGQDPALNLPGRIQMVASENTDINNQPRWNTSATHQKLRQFFVLRPHDPANPALSDAPVTVAPTAGDEVVFQVRIYNYSVLRATGPIDVRFVAQRVEDADLPSGGKPIVLGTQTLQKGLAAGASDTVSQSWKTVGPEGNIGEQTWRIFVIVDPSNKLAETHEWKATNNGDSKPPVDENGKPFNDPLTGKGLDLEAGQNNQGYGSLTVHAPPSTSLGALQEDPGAACDPKEGDELAAGPDTHVSPAGLTVAGPQGRFTRQASRVRARVSKPLMLRMPVLSSHRDLRQQHVLLWDGHPDNGGSLISSEIVQGISRRDGTPTSFDWVPRRAGAHRLFAQVLEHGNDRQRGNAYSRLAVRVARQRFPRPRLRALTALVGKRSYPAKQRRRLVAGARRAHRELHRGSLAGTRRELRAFTALARKGRGRTVRSAEVRLLARAARTIGTDLRVKRVAGLIRRSGAPAGKRKAMLAHVAKVPRAIAAGRLRKARRHVRAIAVSARGLRSRPARARALASAARNLRYQLR